MREYIIRRTVTPSDSPHFGKWVCHVDSLNWREYTAMWEADLESMFKFVAGMGGHITGWTTRDNEIMLTVRF